MRRVKIVATVGPATSSREALEPLLRAGVDVVRLNFAHGRQEDHARVVELVRGIAKTLDRPIAILQDLGGPKIRIGALVGSTPVHLVPNTTVTITTKPVEGTSTLLSVNYERLPLEVRKGDRILLADGAISLRVKRGGTDEVKTVVEHGGLLAEHQGINLPGIAISAPALTDKDRADLAFGVKLGVDFVGISFVRDPSDVRQAKALIAKRGANIPVIAKLEKREAVEHLDAILDVSDGVMVARGDLGVELPLEEVPVLQKTIIQKANERGIPVITATQMLESMIHSPRPTRAEVSDVANAILDGTDAVMLSGETAVGQFPTEAVEMMGRIAGATHELRASAFRPAPKNNAEAIVRVAADLAESVRAAALVVFTRSGLTAGLLSQERPGIPILALTDDERVYRRLALRWGVRCLLTTFQENTDAMIDQAEHLLIERHLVRKGEHVVVAASSPVFAESRTNFVKIQRITGG